MRRIVISLPVIALLIGGCPEEQPDEGPVLMFADYRSAFMKTVSEYFVRCGFVDASRVKQLEEARLLGIAPELQVVIDQEIRANRVRLTTGCFSSLASAPCDITEALALIESCTTGGGQYIPRVPNGFECKLPGECTDGFCDLGALKKPCGVGVCSAYLTIGTQCGPGKGLCDPTRASCYNGTCRARGRSGAGCASDNDCEKEFTCRADGAQSACAPRQKDLGTNAACNPGQIPDGCRTGDRCVEVVAGEGGRCLTPVAVGMSCRVTQECAGSAVCVGSNPMTGQQGTCRAQGRLGEPCDQPGSICQLTLYCSQQTGTCKAAGRVGEACDAAVGGQACLSGVCSATSGTSGSCKAPAPQGSACTAAGECSSGICSIRNQCAAVCGS